MLHRVVLSFFVILTFLSSCLSLWPFDSESCQSPWVKHDFDLLHSKLSRDFYGQHVASRSAFKIIKAHIKNPQPQKPLVLSLHGSPGTGKTFFAKMVAESLYKLGTKSKHVIFFDTEKDFKVDRDSLEQAAMFRESIESNLTDCEFSMFVIEDANLMNPKLLDVLLPYVNYPPVLNGINYNRAIFIFICNSGSEIINKYVYDQIHLGRNREDISSVEMHHLLHDDLMKKEKPFDSSVFVQREVVDAFIPFFPLEKEHVRECVYAILGNFEDSHITSDMVDEIVNSIRYFPEGEELFAVSGCKRLDYIVAEYI